jgi:hypothetical protein
MVQGPQLAPSEEVERIAGVFEGEFYEEETIDLVRDGLLLVAHMHQMMSTGGSKALFG